MFVIGDMYSFTDAHQLFRFVDARGAREESRLGPVSNLENVSIESRATFLPYRPGMIRRLGFVEILQTITGYFDTRHLAKAIPNLQYDYGIQDAYGIRLALQLPKVIDQLSENPGTRRAMLHLGTAGDGQEETKPCNQSINLRVKDGALDMTIFVRSWDAISGLPYDVINFNGVNQILANVLGVNPGVNTWLAASLHTYDHAIARVSEYGSPGPKLPWTDFEIPSYIVASYGSVNQLESWRRWAIDELNNMDSWEHGVPKGVIIYD